MTDLPEEAKYLTVGNLQAIVREWRKECGCEPICPTCREWRNVGEVIIRGMRRAGVRTIEGVSYLYPDPENPGHLAGVGPLIEVTSEFVGYYLKWGIQPMADLPGSLVTVIADPAGPMFLNILADNGYFVWELHELPWEGPRVPMTFLGVWPD